MCEIGTKQNSLDPHVIFFKDAFVQHFLSQAPTAYLRMYIICVIYNNIMCQNYLFAHNLLISINFVLTLLC